MNRFIMIRVSGDAYALESIARHAHELRISPGQDKGFDIIADTRAKLELSWFEKVVIERRIENGQFGDITYQEVKIINFGLILFSNSNRVILVDPPLGKHRATAVLRTIFPSSNLVFLPIDVKSSVEAIQHDRQSAITALETESVAVNSNISVSIIAVGRQNVSKHLTDTYPQFNKSYKSAQITSHIRSGGQCGVTVSTSGLVRFTSEVTHMDIEEWAKILVFKE